jgi:hypothetical protein
MKPISIIIMDITNKFLNMKHFSEFSVEDAKKIRVVFSDIDDTISSEGKILPKAYEAMWKLYESNIDVVPITGRCAGWVDHIARMWPVKGLLEKGACLCLYGSIRKPFND